MKDLFGKIFNKQQNIDDLSVEAKYTNAYYADISTIVNDANADNISTMANTSQNATTEERKGRKIPEEISFISTDEVDSLSTDVQFSSIHDADVSTVTNPSQDGIPEVVNTKKEPPPQIPEKISFVSIEERKRRVKSAPLYIPGMLDDESLISETSKISLPDEIKPDSEALLKIHQQQMEFREREQQRKDTKVEQTGRSGV
ncbi:MAG: hypothetical protein COV35_01750 [Alphaproteobacteria bacterium CG11_big_fil_rev_8_21_14_0_20_39_49]|nr:MAG: hypothetical protein COV35_01750 [Alphaproteobacteria bacterium CG11_big_fil_rev_8_21_14_0_20_39_49]